MINIAQATKDPYQEFLFNVDRESFSISVKYLYREELKYYKVNIKSAVSNNNSKGEVDVIVKKQALITNREIRFANLLVPERICNKGVGNVLMKSVMEVSKDFKKYFEIDGIVYISGWLSSADYKNGNWKISLPFYEKFAARNDIEVVFKERSSGIEYMEAKDYLELAFGKDGDVIFKI